LKNLEDEKYRVFYYGSFAYKGTAFTGNCVEGLGRDAEREFNALQ